MKPIDFLLECEEPWTKVRTMIDLMGLDESDPEVIKAKLKMLEHPLVKALIEELGSWPGVVLSSHKSAGQLYHKLAFLADLGLNVDDRGIKEILDKVRANTSEEGLVQLPMNIPVHFGGTGQVEWAWALCDAPIILYSLSKMGDVETRKGVDYLVQYVRENGWPCAVSKELGKFRGPGRKDDPCPYVNLIMLKLLANFPEYIESDASHRGVECLLSLWEKSKQSHPYMFFMGTDFRKLKAPFIWYDILHVVETLSQFNFALSDERFAQMLDVIHSKVNKEGLYTPESEWKAWKEWDFGQKKNPSSWLTFLVYRINERSKKNKN